MLKSYFALLFVFISVALLSQESLQPPIAQKRPVCDTIHGDIRCDEYQWMRQKNSPEVINHLYAENGYAERYMKQHSLLIKKIYEEVKGKIVEDIQSEPSRSKKHLYYTRYEKGKEYPKYFRKADTLNAPEILLLDIDSLAKNFANFNLSSLSISPSNERLLYGIDTKGDRLMDVYFKSINSEEIYQDTIKQIIGICWFGNDEVIYTIPEKDSKRSFKAYKHKLNTPKSEDILIAFEKDPVFQLSFSRSSSERFVFMGSTSTLSSEFSFFDFENPGKGFQLIEPRKPNHVYSPAHVDGESFIVNTDFEAPNGKLMLAPVNNPSQSNWQQFLPHRDDVLLSDFAIYGDYLIVVEQFDARERLVKINRKNGQRDTIELPDEPSSVGLSSYYEHDEGKFRYSFTTMKHPGETWEVDLTSGEGKFIHRDTINGNYNPADYISERIYAISQDGESIPITLLYKKGLKKDGANPLWINAYGSYGNSSLPGFSISSISLADRGFVVATAHVRGGSDCGRYWYDNGKLLKKKNTFYDLIACTEKLISDNYSKADKIVVSGGSAGGLLVGAVMNMRPDLFGAAIANVPFVDVINTMLDSSLPLTTFEYDEWGNPNDSVYYHYIKSYAPYENVKAMNYPPILATAGYNDSQVPYWEPAKWVSRLRSLKTDSNVVLFKTNMDAGHGGSSGRYGRLKDMAFDYAFAFQAIGLEENYIVINGTTKDSEGNILPFVNVYIEGTTQATASNENGRFSLEIKKGDKLNIVFSSIGFKKVVIPITINTPLDNLDVLLQAENYQIKTFEVRADAKDPAYAVMKKAIEKRKFHLEQVDSYSSDIYIKGAVRLDKIPEKLPFFISKSQMPDSSDLGLVYLSESVARYHEKKPDLVKEEMMASKVAGLKQGFSWNRVSDVLMNFYKNLVDIAYYSDRGFVSPVSESAMFYYKYKMIGTFVENGLTINRISIEPRRKFDPCFRGEIFIVDDFWNIHSLDLQLTKDAQIEFVDTLFIRQEYVAVEDNIWMPLTLQLMSHISVFGFSATDKSIGVFSNYKINPPYDKRFFGNEIFKIEEKANQKDTVFWEDTRPVTLTEEEIENYRKADSTEQVQSSKPYLDSLDRVTNKIGIGDVLFGGIDFSNSFEKKFWRVSPLITMASFNVVEGLYLNPELVRRVNPENNEISIFKASVRYGFSDYRYKPSASYFKLTNPSNFNWWYIKGGRMMSQINGDDPIQPIVNAGYTLLDKRNLIRLYEKTGLEIIWNKELLNGLMFQGAASWFQRIIPNNKSDFSFSDKNDAYSLNRDLVDLNDKIENYESTYAGVNIKMSYRIKQKYETRGNRKIIRGSKWPLLTVEYEQALSGIAGSDVKFSRMEFAVSDRLDLGLLGNFSYKVIGGTFLDNSNMTFIDYRHFNGNETFFLRNFASETPYNIFRNGLNRFNALPYYSSSTNGAFAQFHIEQDFSNWLTNKIPLLRLARLQTLIGSNILWRESQDIYTEFYLGINNILKAFRIDFVSQYTPGKAIKPLVRIGIDF
jgi:oligopeptidase B